MNNHPLTDEICDSIQDSIHPCDPADMRAAADWQYDKCFEEMEAMLVDLVENHQVPEEVAIHMMATFDRKLRP